MATTEEYAQKLKSDDVKFHVSTNYYREVFFSTSKRGVLVGIEFTDHNDVSEHRTGVARYEGLRVFGEVGEWNVLMDKWLLYEVVASFESKEETENYINEQGDADKYHCVHIDEFVLDCS